MAFEMAPARTVLERTPLIVEQLTGGLPDAWLQARPRAGEWNAHQVVAHLLHTEQEVWLVRTRIIVERGPSTPFPPVEHGDQSGRYPGVSTADLVQRLADERAANLAQLDAMQLSAPDLERDGTHPSLGRVTLAQVFATWVVHDHNHVRQLQEALASYYAADVGPWRSMLGVLDGADA